MSAEAVPGLLLALSLALALTGASPRARGMALAGLVATAGMAAWLWPDGAREDLALIGGWATLAVCITALYLPRRVTPAVALALALVAGVWIGGLAASHGTPRDLAIVLPAALLALPGAWVAKRWPVALQLLAGWLLAVAILSAALPFVSLPGYAADHAE